MRTEVVGVVIIDDGRALVAHRADRPAGTGWEFPGGKREPGETLEAAAVREVREELDVEVRVTGRIPGAEPINDQLELCLVTATTDQTIHGSADHDDLRWLDATTLASVGWLAPDLPFLPAVAALLREDAS